MGPQMRVAVAALLLAGLCAASVANDVAAQSRRAGAAKQSFRAIEVDASASVTRVPDLAIVRLGISGDAPVENEALARHSANVLRLLGTIREAGVAPRDIEQARPIVEPVFETWLEVLPDGIEDEAQGNRIGFRATTWIVVTLRDIVRAGPVIQQFVRAGATFIESIDFELTPLRRQAAEAEAREAAVGAAVRYTTVVASAANAGRPQLISAGPPPPADGKADLGGAGPEPREWGPAMALEPGTIEITETVRAVFRMTK